MAAFAGLRGTGTWGTGERPKSFREMILFFNPNGQAPLTALLAKAQKETVDDPEFNWWSETLDILRLKIDNGAGYDSTDQTMTVIDKGLQCVPGDVFLCEKDEASTYDEELMIVSSVTSDTVVVFKRGISGTTPAALVDTEYLTKVSSAFEEGSGSADISQRNPSKEKNYTQIFKTSMGITGTAGSTHTRTGDSWTNDKKRKMFDHSRDLEMAFLFGRPYEDTNGDHAKRYTGGLRHFISSNVTIFGTTPTEDTLLDAIYPVFDFQGNGSGDERIMFCGNGFLNSLNRLARTSSSTRCNFDGYVKNAYGMNLQRWITPQGTFGVRTHPLLNRHGRFTYSAFIIDPSVLVWRPLKGRDTKFMDNIQDNDADERKAQWLTEVGLEIQFEATCAYLGNFVV